MFCPQCGSKISNEAEFCPTCGKNLEKAKNFLNEASTISDISNLKQELEFSLEGDISVLSVKPYNVNKFYLKVKNNSLKPIYDVNIKLSGPPHIELLTNLIKLQVIDANSTNSAPISVLPKGDGIFTLTARLLSNTGHTLIDSFELRTEAPKSIAIGDIPKQSKQKTYSYTSRSSGRTDQVVAVLVIFALFGIILMISGGVSFLVGGLPISAGITFLVIGFIFLGIGTKGKCCIVPFYCADCDCDC